MPSCIVLGADCKLGDVSLEKQGNSYDRDARCDREERHGSNGRVFGSLPYRIEIGWNEYMACARDLRNSLV